MSSWSLDQARKTYSIPHWAEGYFDVDAAGHVVVSPQRRARARRSRCPKWWTAHAPTAPTLPLLVRFPDILGDRLGKLQAAFAQAHARVGLRRRLHRGVSDQGQPAPRRRRHAGLARAAKASAWKRAASRS